VFCAPETARNFFVAGLSLHLQKILIRRILLDKILVMTLRRRLRRAGLRAIPRMKMNVR
jgi:hypothetical protein